MTEDVMRGRRILGSTRPPKSNPDKRVCAAKGCDTVLSRYNRRDHCYTHAPVKFPRLRGRIVPES